VANGVPLDGFPVESDSETRAPRRGESSWLTQLERLVVHEGAGAIELSFAATHELDGSDGGPGECTMLVELRVHVR
jgi:hypothetical protein